MDCLAERQKANDCRRNQKLNRVSVHCQGSATMIGIVKGDKQSDRLFVISASSLVGMLLVQGITDVLWPLPASVKVAVASLPNNPVLDAAWWLCTVIGILAFVLGWISRLNKK